MRPEAARLRPALMLAAALACAPAVQAQIYTRVNARGVVEATNVPDEPDFRLTYPGKGTLIHSRGFRRAYSGEYDRHVTDAVTAHGVPAALVKAVIQVESEFDPLAVSSKGAQGLMQLMPATAQRFGVDDPFDPRQNVFGGVQYLRFLLDLFQGDVPLALAAYNAGENAVLRFKGIPPYRETQSYVRKVQALVGSDAPVLAFAPALRAAREAAPAREARVEPARPRTYYRWQDDKGRLHVAETPPEDGVAYTTIRALD